MPLALYVPLHPEARLSEEDRGVLVEWAKAAMGTGTSDHEDHEDHEDGEDEDGEHVQ